MSDQLKKTLIGALVAAALAIAVSYGLVSQQTADKIQDQTNQTLQGNQTTSSPTPQQPAPPAPAPQQAPAPASAPDAQAPAPTAPAPQPAAPATRQ